MLLIMLVESPSKSSASWKTSLVVLSLLAVVSICGCGTVGIEEPCLISNPELGRYESLRGTNEPKLREFYSFNGVYYEEWEESGLIAEGYFGEEALQSQKYGAYCVRIDTTCQSYLDPPRSAAYNSFGVAAAAVRALVQFQSRSGSAGELASNQCLKGTLRVVQIASIRWK